MQKGPVGFHLGPSLFIQTFSPAFPVCFPPLLHIFAKQQSQPRLPVSYKYKYRGFWDPWNARRFTHNQSCSIPGWLPIFTKKNSPHRKSTDSNPISLWDFLWNPMFFLLPDPTTCRLFTQHIRLQIIFAFRACLDWMQLIYLGHHP